MMVRLTYVHWHNKTRGLLLVNPDFVAAVVPDWRDGATGGSVVTANGCNYTVAETPEEVAAAFGATPPDGESGEAT